MRHAGVPSSTTPAASEGAAPGGPVAGDVQRLCEPRGTPAQRVPATAPESATVVQPLPCQTNTVANKQQDTAAQQDQPGVAHRAGLEANNPAAVDVAAAAASRKQAAYAKQEALLAIMRGQSPPPGAIEQQAGQEVCASTLMCEWPFPNSCL